MRQYMFLGLALFAASLALMIPTGSDGQFPMGGSRPPWSGGGGPGGFGGGGRGFRTQDPNALFDNFLAKGRPYFLISDLQPTSRLREPLTQFAQKNGITDGKISREKFLEFNEQMRAMSGLPPAPPPTTGAAPAPTSPGSPPSAGPDLDSLNRWADAEFRRYDRNQDGKLNNDEMPDALKSSLSKWDGNNDGLIDQNEYRLFFIARWQSLEQSDPGKQANPVASIIVEEEDWDRRPAVLRAGKLPKNGLPSWFKDLDTDNDGQVALYEWRAAGKPMDEFQTWDTNDDGFITPEEAMKYQAVLAKNNPKGDPASFGAMASSGRPSGGPGGWGGFSGFGRKGSDTGSGGPPAFGRRGPADSSDPNAASPGGSNRFRRGSDNNGDTGGNPFGGFKKKKSSN